MKFPTPPSRRRTVSSLFRNIEKLATELAPNAGSALLGATWSFDWQGIGANSTLCEYSLPASATSFVERIARRTGLLISEHGHDAAPALVTHLKMGAPAIVAVDSFYLPYRPAYGRVHSHRTIIVRGNRPGARCWVEDEWPPAYQGPVSWRDLEKARYSKVPLDMAREPLFSGRPVEGDWYGVHIQPISMFSPRTWALWLLRELLTEITSGTTSELSTDFGLSGFRKLRADIGKSFTQSDSVATSGWRIDLLRYAILTLRAELSCRVYLCSLLQSIAWWTGYLQLREDAASYYRSLRHMEMSRDVLTKALRHFRPEYKAFVLDLLENSISAEECLVERVRLSVTTITADLESVTHLSGL